MGGPSSALVQSLSPRRQQRKTQLHADMVLTTLQSNINLKRKQNQTKPFFNFDDYVEKVKMGSIGNVCSATCLWHIHINIVIKILKSILEFPLIFTRSDSKEAARLSPTFATEPALRAK